MVQPVSLMLEEQQSQQFLIIHLSDIHFGDGHAFSPERTTSGEESKEILPTLTDSLVQDLNEIDSENGDLLLMITGDLTQSGSEREFLEAKKLVEGLICKTGTGNFLSLEKTFIVPGNHDVKYDEQDYVPFWNGYHTFYKALFGPAQSRNLKRVEEERFCKLHDLSASSGLIVLELASCHRNHKDTEDLQRGSIDQVDLLYIEEQLKELDKKAARNSVKIALLHHHPVLIPPFAEPNRNYDAVVNSAHLLNLLSDFQFQLVLHGHKHNPHSFSYDATCGFFKSEQNPLLIVAGGSVGSKELGVGISNSYNLIKIRHNFRIGESRIEIKTRALVNRDEYNRELLRHKWHWKTVKSTDKLLVKQRDDIRKPIQIDSFKNSCVNDSARNSEYIRLRQNFPTVEVIPSLKTGQEFEAILKIVGHKYRTEKPQKVVWNAGPSFPIVTCIGETNSDFRCSFAYFGPMLIECTMYFEGNVQECCFLYAHER